MRLALLFAATKAASGTWAAGTATGFLPMPGQMLQAITALGGDPAKVSVGTINPRQSYSDVMRKVTTSRGEPPAGFHPSTVTVPSGSFSAMTTPSVNADTIAKNGFNARILSEMQQNNQRMQNMTNYARNPAGWHGAPPN